MGDRRQRAILAILALFVAGALATGAAAEQASQPAAAAAAQLDVSGGAPDHSGHSCAIASGGDVRCWGFGGAGRLGYGSTTSIGDDESPGSAGPVDLGAGRAAAVSAGAFHTCALLDNSNVHCWGFGGDGRLGYGNTATIGDDETPAAAGPVDLGPSGTARAISAGAAHTCAVVDGGGVHCWGFGGHGRLGYPNPTSPTDLPAIGDDETPASAGRIDLGLDRTAIAITAGGRHTCALLDNGSVRCWGDGADGRLGYASTANVGAAQTPGSVGPVNLGAGRTAVAISAGEHHTCAVLDDGTVRCWGFGGNGRLGYANLESVGDNETPGSVAPVNLGAGRTARAISVGDAHTCALLDEDGGVLCWGYGEHGRLGYGATTSIGDDETPGSVGPVDLGAGRHATAISAGGRQTCARLDDASVRCWGQGSTGRLGYCNERDIGDDEVPGSVGPVNLSTAVDCRAAGPPISPPPGPPPGPPPPGPPAPGPPAPTGLSTAKLSLARATINRRDRVLDVLAPITRRASGRARIELHAAGQRYRFTTAVNSRDGRIRFRQRIPKAQADLGTGILTITYPGDGDTRPQTVRLRAASQHANLRLSRPTIANGRLRASGTVSARARGVVRIQTEYVVADKTTTLQFKAPIRNGRWSLNQRLSQTVRNEIAQRTGTVHSYTLFTGYMQRRVRGEMRSFQILAAP